LLGVETYVGNGAARAIVLCETTDFDHCLSLQ
jgi:hypothetical protein